jgi:molybdate transport system permease protein
LSALEIEALEISLKVAFWAVLISLPFGIAVSWLLARVEFPGKIVVDGIVHLPLVLPPVAVGFLLIVLLGQKGFIGAWLLETFDIRLVFTWQGAAVASGIMAFPLMVRAIRLSMETMDIGLETAARTLGASPLRAFFTITIPLIAPGILSGVILAFARSLSEFGATIVFAGNVPGETNTIPVSMFVALQSPGGEEAATRLSLIAIAVAIITLMLSQHLANRLKGRIR